MSPKISQNYKSIDLLSNGNSSNQNNSFIKSQRILKKELDAPVVFSSNFTVGDRSRLNSIKNVYNDQDSLAESKLNDIAS